MQTEGNNTGVAPVTPKWPELIKQKRADLSESQTVFGKRFGVSHAAVSDWERGVSEPPAAVIWWLAQEGVGDGTEK